MSMPDPRHAAASAPVPTPPAPQWGGESPSVIDPGLIAKLANAFLNASPGQIADPQALASFAAAHERPAAPPSSLPGAIGAAAAAPGTSVLGAQSVPFTTQVPVFPLDTARAPAQHIPAAGLASGTTGGPAGIALSPAGAAIPGPVTEHGQPPAPDPRAGEAGLRALPLALGPLTALTAPGVPAGFSHGLQGAALPAEALYFLDSSGAAPAQPSTVPASPSAAAAAPGIGIPGGQTGPLLPREIAHPSLAPDALGAPKSEFALSPAYGKPFPTEAELRPQGVTSLNQSPSSAFPAGFSHETVTPAHPISSGELNYFVNEAQAAATPANDPAGQKEDPRHAHGLTGLKPLLEPGLLSGTRAFDAQAIKRDFPILQQQVHGKPLIWLDNAATTQKPQAVIDRVSLFYENENSNIHRGAHALAARSTDAYEAAREKVRRFLGAGSPDEIVFVRGATEAINLVAQSWGRRNVHEGDEIVITWLEHHANIVPWQMLCSDKGAVLRVAPVDDTGQVILEEYTKLLSPKTRLVSLPQVSNALGTVTPAQEMVAIAQRHGACVLVDGAQAVSHMPVNVQALDCDFYVFSGHKVFAPTGIGVLYGKPEVLAAMPPWQGGGNMITDVTFEKTSYQAPPLRFEAGTGNIADAVGLGAAIDYLDRIGMGSIATYEHELLGYATQGLLGVPGLTIIGTAKEKAGVISFVLDGCRAEDVGVALDREGIAVRAGHHCAQPILRRFGLEATVRPSLALYNTHEDIDALVAALHRIQAQKSYRAR
ncbi:MAG: SufS family cysteine desulfurase [Beijerinckiaceae bacterium]|nr:SufS family cysteine desulfurase [Beijerinckiaceae bacterium]MCI0737326.1 SufS family cysteine desulfurase [Beijerinckiaceae bacterium]